MAMLVAEYDQKVVGSIAGRQGMDFCKLDDSSQIASIWRADFRNTVWIQSNKLLSIDCVRYNTRSRYMCCCELLPIRAELYRTANAGGPGVEVQ